MPLTPEEQVVADAATAAAVKAAQDKAEADKVAAIAAERQRSKEAREAAEAAQAKVKELQDAEAARVSAALEKDKEFEKLAAHNKALAEKAASDLVAANTAADAKVAAIQNERVAERRQAALADAARAAGLIHLDDITKVDATKISWGEDGKPVGAEAAFAALKADRPHYFKVDGAAGGGGGAATGPGALGLPTPPAAGGGGGGSVDAYALDPKEFDRQYAQLGKVTRA